jgi:RNA polymerase sigma-70 factor (ECF subfamily)
MKKGEYNHLSDSEVVELISQKGEKDLFEILYRRYHQKVFEKCYTLLKNRSVAEELAEDIFSKVYEKILSTKSVTHFSSWLYSLTYNQCIDYLREKKRLHYPEWNRLNEIAEIPDESEEDFSEIDYDLLQSVLEMIHPEEKALLMMKYQDNLSLKDIGKSLRISDDAVKMRLKRARTRVIYLYKRVTNSSNDV